MGRRTDTNRTLLFSPPHATEHVSPARRTSQSLAKQNRPTTTDDKTARSKTSRSKAPTALDYREERGSRMEFVKSKLLIPQPLKRTKTMTKTKKQQPSSSSSWTNSNQTCYYSSSSSSVLLLLLMILISSSCSTIDLVTGFVNKVSPSQHIHNRRVAPSPLCYRKSCPNAVTPLLLWSTRHHPQRGDGVATTIAAPAPAAPASSTRLMLSVSSSNSRSSSSRSSSQSRRRSNYNPHKQQQQQQQRVDYRTYEEKEKRELEWLVRTTSRLLGPAIPTPENEHDHHYPHNDNDESSSSSTTSSTSTTTTTTNIVGQMTKREIHQMILLMESWCRRASMKRSQAPHVVEHILKRLVQERDAGNQNVTIDTKIYNILLQAWSNSKVKGSAERCEEIIHEMEQRQPKYKQQTRNSTTTTLNNNDIMIMKPNQESYNSLIKAHVQNGNRQLASIHAQSVINRMIALNDTSVTPNRRSYNLLLYALSNSYSPLPSSQPHTPQRDHHRDHYHDQGIHAEEILRTMLQEYHTTNNNSIKPDINTYNQVLGAHIRSRQIGYEEKIQSLFDEIWKDYITTYNHNLNTNNNKEEEQPQSSSSSSQLDDTSTSTSSTSSSPLLGIVPNTNTFNAMMGGYLKSNSMSSQIVLEKFVDIVSKMEQSCLEFDNHWAQPDQVSMNTIAAAYAKYGRNIINNKSSSSSNGDALTRLMEFHSTMEHQYGLQPDTISHNMIIDGWSKSGRIDAPERAMELLKDMEHRFKNGEINSKPDAFSYSSVMDCYTKSGRIDSGEMAEEILHQMEDLYQHHGGDPIVTPVYNALVNAWASSDSEYAAERARALLQAMEDEEHKKKKKKNQPKATVLTDVDDHHPRGSSGGGGGRSSSCIPPPDRITYNTVMKAMRGGTTTQQAQYAQYAEELLNSMEEKGQVTPALLPDSYTYTSVISAYGRSTAECKAVKAMEFLQRLLVSYKNGHVGARPQVQTFNAALNACAFVQGNWTLKSESFMIAMTIWDLLCQYSQPDHTSYGTLLRACASLLPTTDPLRMEKVEYFFEQACKHGQVSNMVLKQLTFAATPSQHLRLTGHDSFERISLKDLPRAWTRKVPAALQKQGGGGGGRKHQQFSRRIR